MPAALEESDKINHASRGHARCGAVSTSPIASRRYPAGWIRWIRAARPPSSCPTGNQRKMHCATRRASPFVPLLARTGGSSARRSRPFRLSLVYPMVEHEDRDRSGKGHGEGRPRRKKRNKIPDWERERERMHRAA